MEALSGDLKKNWSWYMQVGDLAIHTPTGDFVIILDMMDNNAYICFSTGYIIGFKQWYSTDFLEVI